MKSLGQIAYEGFGVRRVERRWKDEPKSVQLIYTRLAKAVEIEVRRRQKKKHFR